MAGWAQSCTHLYSENLKQEHFFHIRLFLVREYGSADFVRNFSKKHLRVIKIHPMLVPILNIQAVKCNTSVKALLQCYIKFCRLTIMSRVVCCCCQWLQISQHMSNIQQI